jgi:PAS domain S-box-containing protein
MPTPLRVLIVEDNADDAELMVLHLKHSGFESDWHRVETETDYLSALEKPADLILSDWSLPHFSGVHALQLLNARGLDVPFIIVSGSIGEEAAIDALRNGADDYVLKDRPARLGPSVTRALEDRRLHKVQQQAERALRESEERYRSLFNGSPVGVYRTGEDGRIQAANPALAELFGFESPDELVGLNARDFYVNPEEQRRWREAVGRAAVLHDSEIQMRRKDGAVIWARDSGRIVRDESGRLVHYEGTLSDVTERKEAEQALRDSEERYRDLVENIRELICTHDVRGRLLSFNRSAMELTGYAPDELLGIDMRELLLPAHRTLFERYLATLLRTGAANGLMTIVTRSGEQRIWEYHNTLRTQGVSEPTVRGYARDVTEQMRAERALRESEERYRAVIYSASDAIISTDGAGTVVAWNPGAERMFGHAEAEFLGQPLTRLLPTHFVAGHVMGMERLRTGGESQILGRTLEAEGLRKDGQRFPLELSLSEWQVAGEKFYTAIIRDITERKRAEETLRKRVTEMEALYQTSLEILARNDLPELLAAIVESVARLTGGDRGALYMPTADGTRIRVHISHNMGRDYLGTELELGEGISGLAAQERRTIMIEDYGAWEGRSPKFLADGVGRVLAVPMQVGERLIGVLNVADSMTGPYGEDDIRLAGLFADQAAMAIESARLVSETNRRAAYLEALTSTAGALRAAVKPQEMYADVLGQVVDQLKALGATLALVDPETGGTDSVLAVGAWRGTTGMRLSPGEGIVGKVTATGRTFTSDDIRGDPRLARPELLQDLPAIACVPLKVEDQIVGCVMVGRREPLSPEEVRLLTGLAEISANAIYRMQVLETLETRVRQRTQELEAANERLQELDRLKTEFVSNVTHELRTPITNVLLYLDLARRTLSEPKRGHYFDVLKSESVRLGTLIESVLTLSRLERGVVPMELEPHPLDALLADVFVGYQARAEVKGIVLDHEPDENLPVAWVNRVQMHQVLANLVGNAVAYAPPGERVHLGTARTQVGGRDYVGAVVHNSGTVIPPEDMEHMFQRFYRGAVGRESGEPGTGLGLAISKEIVELHHGWIDVESSEQAGTTFTVWLPQAALT